MKTLFKISAFLLLSALISNCQQESDLGKELTALGIDDLIKKSDEFNVPQSEFTETLLDEDKYNEATSGVEFLCDVVNVKRTDVLENLTLNAFDDRTATNTAALYPGSIVKLRDLKNLRDLNGIGNYERSSMEISSTLGDIRKVEDPSQRGNVDKAIKEIESTQQGDFAANIRYKVVEAYSLEQAMLELGVDVKYLTNSVRSKFQMKNSVEEKSVFIQFFQVYHTVSIGNPVRPSDLFGPSVSSKQLEEVTTEDNPLGYIAEVAYGRILVGKFTYKGTKYSSKTSLSGQVKAGLAVISGDASGEIDKELSEATFDVAILGGSATEADNVSGGAGLESVQKAYEFMQNGGNDPSLGVPVQYKVRYLSSNNLFSIGGAAEYNVPTCDQLPTGVKILDITCESLEDKSYDPGSAFPSPELYPRILENGSTAFNYRSSFGDAPSVQVDELPKTFNLNNNAYKVGSLRGNLSIQWWDQDVASNFDGDDKIGTINFNWGDYKYNSANPYPTTVRKTNGSISTKLVLEWLYD